MRFAILQTNPIVADVHRNFDTLARLIRQHADRADLFVTCEQALIGYPARDLLSQKWLLDQEAAHLEALRALSLELNIGILVGHCEPRSGSGRPLYNCASLFDKGVLQGKIRKRRIPSYDIFDEERFFEAWPSQDPQILSFREKLLGVSICEDGWDSVLAFGTRDVRSYEKNPLAQKTLEKTDVIINLSASPYGVGKRQLRQDLFGAAAARAGRPLIYSNCAGGQDDLVFDGASFTMNSNGSLAAQAAAFREDVLLCEWTGDAWKHNTSAPTLNLDNWEEVEAALELGLRDFVRKCGHEKVVLGLSGGIDSALCAVLAVRALGPKNVLGVSLPTKITSDLSKSEAADLASRLGIEFRELPIQAAVDAEQSILGVSSGLPYENLQSRTRGLLLTTLANHEQRLVLATGNKSEYAMGYSTLYGDMCGALAPIGDLYKTEVYALCYDINRRAIAQKSVAPIPEPTLKRPPTAELAPGQKDADSLPEYDILDAVLKELIENQGATIFDESTWNRLLAPRFTVAQIRHKFLLQEFKRRQAAPILKIHQRSFGAGWRVPVAKGLP